MNFQERLKARIKDFETNLTPRFQKIILDDIQKLKDSGQQSRVLKVGDAIPDIKLPNQKNELVDIKDLLHEGPLIITFYRGFWCVFCNLDLANLNTYLPEIERLGAKMVSLSPERLPYSKKIIARQKLNYDILFDEDNRVAEQFNLKHSIGKDLKDLYLNGFNVNMKQIHGNDEWALPMPAKFLVDQNGIIQFSESKADYRDRPDPDDLMKILKTMQE